MEVSKIPLGCQRLTCDHLSIACYWENMDASTLEKVKVYAPYNYLVFVEQGILELITPGRRITIPKGYFCLVSKHTKLTMVALPDEMGQPLKLIKFALYDAYIHNVINSLKAKEDLVTSQKEVLPLFATNQLLAVVDLVKQKMSQGQMLSCGSLQGIMEHALKNTIELCPEVGSILIDQIRPGRQDLIQFMEKNFLLDFSMEEMALLYGSSLSTFNREVKRLLYTTPQKWIIKRRLHYAYSLMISTSLEIKDIAFETNFIDLAHFSRSFKNEFGQCPSDFRVSRQPKKHQNLNFLTDCLRINLFA